MTVLIQPDNRNDSHTLRVPDIDRSQDALPGILIEDAAALSRPSFFPGNLQMRQNNNPGDGLG